ncbi:MAG: phosphotriesterase family protein [Anaerolineae bacterium]
MSYFVTVTGRIDVDDLGMILPHEHVVTDLRPHDAPSFGRVDEADVVRVMRPHIEAVRAAGVTAIVECTPGSIGRNVLAMRALSRATGFPIVAAAGVYREQLMPEWVRHTDDEQLVERLRGEVMDGMDGTEITGGFIKLAVSDTGVTDLEERVLRAAGRVGSQYGVTVASHTVGGASAVREADILAEEGLPPERFVWVHTQTEPDLGYHREVAGRGCYLGYDGISKGSDLDAYAVWVRRAFEGGYQERVLLSQDAGWYRPGEPEGGAQRPYDYMPRVFLPLLLRSGFSQEDVTLLTDANPKRAFARE